VGEGDSVWLSRNYFSQRLCFTHRTASYSTASSNSAADWIIPPAQRLKYKQIFNAHDSTHKGFLTGMLHVRMLTLSVYSNNDMFGSN